MKVRIGDNTLIDIYDVMYIEIEESSIIIKFKNNWETREFFRNDLEAMCVFNNLNNYLNVKDMRIESKEDKNSLEQRKDKGFEMFWSLYDKKVDINRAKVAFLNLTLKEMGLAVKNAKAYVESTPDKRYRKNPTTWLHQKGWDSDFSMPNKKVNRYVKPEYVNDER